MMMSKATKLVSRVGAALAVTLLAAGCMMGAPDAGDVDGLATPLLEVRPGTEPLAPVSTSEWRRAPRDCHGRLPADVRFELVREGLVVAYDALGNALCVDSVEDVREELEDGGRAGEASDLEDAYMLALGLAIPSTDLDAGDPSPQPSCEDMDTQAGDPTDTGEIDHGDPSPQPSTQPMEPDEP